MCNLRRAVLSSERVLFFCLLFQGGSSLAIFIRICVVGQSTLYMWCVVFRINRVILHMFMFRLFDIKPLGMGHALIRSNHCISIQQQSKYIPYCSRN